MATANKTKIPAGFVISDKYRVTRELGRGGMAAVYEAENVDIGKRVAIKVLAQELTSSTVVVERFLREARAAAAIRSPYICDVYDSGRLEDGRPFLVLELLEGESLYERMTKVRFIDVETTLSVVTQACRGLTKAHAANIVHRDLKPENIFITTDEEGDLLAKILDFGLAKFYAPMDAGSGPQSRLTREGAVFGTPAYMSPEQVRGQGAVDHRADLWALGCITYECLTGRTVWATEQGVAMTFAQIANAPIPDATELRPDLPESFTRWFERALDRTIDNRFQTAKEFAEGLNGAFHQGTPSFSSIHNIAAMIDGTVRQPQSSQGSDSHRRPAAGAPPEHTEDVPVFMSEFPPAQTGAAEGPAPAPSPSSGSQGPSVVTDFPPPQRKSSGIIVALGLLVLLGAGGYFAYDQRFRLTNTATPVPTTGGPDASAAPSASAIPQAPDAVNPDAPDGLPWRPLVAKAQKEIANQNYVEADKLLKEAFGMGGHGVPRTMLEHLGLATAASNANAPCKLTGLSRPRAYDLGNQKTRVVGAGQPSVALGLNGPLIAWTDGREGATHGYAVTLDEALRPRGGAVDVTPEANSVGRPTVVGYNNRFILTYWDAKGPEAGVHVRWLDGAGRIDGPPIPVAKDHENAFWPSLSSTSDSHTVVWSKPTDVNKEDLYFRRLTAKLEPRGEVMRLTDFIADRNAKARARYVSTAEVDGVLHVVFRLERDPDRLVEHLQLPNTDATVGLQDRSEAKQDRVIGELELVNNDRAKASGPNIACTDKSCFVTWHAEASQGAWVAYFEPTSPKAIWRKKFTKTGARPVAAVDAQGNVQLFWFETGRIQTASVDRDGIGATTTLARVSGDQPVASVVAGANPGEWYIAWLDYETGHLEPYAARILCQ